MLGEISQSENFQILRMIIAGAKDETQLPQPPKQQPNLIHTKSLGLNINELVRSHNRTLSLSTKTTWTTTSHRI